MYSTIMRLVALIIAAMLFTVAHAGEPDESLSIEDFLRKPEFRNLQISPTGKYLAMISTDKNLQGIRVLDISNPKKIRQLSAFRFSILTHVNDIMWVSDDRITFSTTKDIEGQQFGRFDTWDIYAMNVDGSDRIKLNPSARMIDGLIDDPDHLLAYRNYRGAKPPEIARIGAYEGEYETLVKSPFEEGFLFRDGNNQWRAAWEFDNEEGRVTRLAYKTSVDSNWEFKEFDYENGIHVVGFHSDNKRLIVRSATKPFGLYAYDFASGETEALVTSNVVETDRLIVNPLTGRTAGAIFMEGRAEAKFLRPDDNLARLYRMLQSAFPDHRISIDSMTNDGRKAIVRVYSDIVPAEYYLFDTENLNAQYLLSSRPWLKPQQLSKMKPIRYTARDGVEIHGYLTLPANASKNRNSMVVIIHGGPHGPYSAWGFDEETQILASRGHAVLNVNFRGSGGYGREFLELGYRRWGTDIQNDIADGVRWAIEKGYADPDNICVYGASFGGYSTLAQLVWHPDLYQCGFAYVGLYDLNLLMEAGDIQTRDSGLEYLQRALPQTQEGRKAQSPIHFVENIDAALYVAHGQKDVRAHAKHFYELMDALEEENIPHETMVKHREGHGFFNEENTHEFYTELVDFIDTHIGD